MLLELLSPLYQDADKGTKDPTNNGTNACTELTTIQVLKHVQAKIDQYFFESKIIWIKNL